MLETINNPGEITTRLLQVQRVIPDAVLHPYHCESTSVRRHIQQELAAVTSAELLQFQLNHGSTPFPASAKRLLLACEGGLHLSRSALS